MMMIKIISIFKKKLKNHHPKMKNNNFNKMNKGILKFQAQIQVKNKKKK